MSTFKEIRLRRQELNRQLFWNRVVLGPATASRSILEQLAKLAEEEDLLPQPRLFCDAFGRSFQGSQQSAQAENCASIRVDTTAFSAG
jgi:hypothetical protein